MTDNSTAELLAYWNAAADTKVFASPLRDAELRENLSLQDPILEIGCGYGRVLGALRDKGFRNLYGVDYSERMVEKARRSLHPDVELKVSTGDRLPFADQSFMAVILYAVLTCIVDPKIEEKVLREANRVLRPGGLVFINDNLLEDGRSAVYARRSDLYGEYGVFIVDDRAQVKHNSESRAKALVSARFDIERFERQTWTAMNGEPANGLFITGRKPQLSNESEM